MLQRCVTRGQGADNGAALIVDARGVKVHLDMPEEKRRLLQLQPGWVVHRHLRAGDRVVMNRQPTLHRGSMLSFKVCPWPELAIGMNPVTAKPFNFDYDGDEMNMHAPQSVEMQAEAMVLMDATQHQISASRNRLLIGPVQDSLVGAYFLSLEDCRVSQGRATYMWMRMCFPHRPLGPPTLPGGMYRGRDLIRCMLPKTLWLRCAGVVIERGELVSGHLTRKSAGTGTGGIAHTLALDYSLQAAAEYSADLQRVACEYTRGHGCTVGIGDCAMPPEVARKRVALKHAMLEKVRSIYDAAQQEGRDPFKDQVIEGAVQRVCGSALGVAGDLVLAEMPADNGVRLLSDTIASKVRAQTNPNLIAHATTTRGRLRGWGSPVGGWMARLACQ